MKLFTNGCSFTWGGAIYPDLHDRYGNILDYANTDPINQQRLKDVWPAHLANALGIDNCVNLSMGCGSNERILRTTFDFFTYETTEKRFTNDWVAVIQWTQAHRYEFWDEQSQSWALVLPAGTNTSRRVHYRELQALDKHKENTYRYLNDETYAQWYWTQIVSLASFFDKLKIPYWFTNLNVDHMRSLGAWQQRYMQDEIRWIGNDMYKTVTSFFKDKHESNSGHPSLLGQQQLAETIYNYIKDDYTKI